MMMGFHGLFFHPEKLGEDSPQNWRVFFVFVQMGWRYTLELPPTQ